MTYELQVAGKGSRWTALFAGDTTLVLEFGNCIDRSIVDQIKNLDTLINAAMSLGKLDGVSETIPTFRSLAIIYDSNQVHPDALLKQLRQLESESTLEGVAEDTSRHWQLPVLYGTEHGPDLKSVAELTDLRCEEVIALHSSCTFSAYMLGFLPGYAFLGDTPEQLHLPRLTEPRLRVPAGSVAIAKQLTGIYPWESPGGWHIVGNCPVPMFDAQLSPPALLKAGDRISFTPIDKQQFEALRTELEQGNCDRNRWSVDS